MRNLLSCRHSPVTPILLRGGAAMCFMTGIPLLDTLCPWLTLVRESMITYTTAKRRPLVSACSSELETDETA